jgi:hypothetical protein
MEQTKSEFGINDENYIKPGLGEATRVLLRRSPQCLLVRDLCDGDIEHVLILAKERSTEVLVRPSLPYRAAAIIKRVLTAGH